MPPRHKFTNRLSVAVIILSITRLFAAEPGPPPTAATEPITSRQALFAYNSHADFAVEEKSGELRGDARVRDVSFVANSSEHSKRIAAYIVEPAKGAPRAAILWVHWLGEPKTTNRTEFLDEAVALAGRGVTSLLIDAMWSKPRWYRDRVLDEDYRNSVAQVVAIRRSLDLLQQQAGAAKVPLAIVGHDYGGMYSTIAAGIDQRAKTYVFIACTESLLDWAFFRTKPASMDAYLAENRPLELSDYLGAINGASILFQCAEHDEYVPLAKAQAFFAAAKSPKQMIVYGGAQHKMSEPETIRLDRIAWLARELGLEGGP